MNQLEKILDQFHSISLPEMDSVKLMDRMDTKYVLKSSTLPPLLNFINDTYNILEIENKRCISYHSTYFDTFGFNMYLQHQNGKSNRYKIRKREYVDSGICFLEVKFKSNKGRTKKTRIRNDFDMHVLDVQQSEFILAQSPYLLEQLQARLGNSFERITLVNKTDPERVTIDLNLQFSNLEGEKKGLPGLCVIEVKKNQFLQKSIIQKKLKDAHIPETRFSKYLMGVHLLHPGLKYNRVKSTLHNLHKIGIQPLIIEKHDIINENIIHA